MKKVLIVDDDQDISEIIQIILEDAEYTTEIVTRGEEAYQRVKEYKPNLILLDILLFGMDGRIICKRLKNLKSTKNIPIIMLSAHPDTEETVKAYGADDFIVKPFHMEVLLKKVKEYIR